MKRLSWVPGLLSALAVAVGLALSLLYIPASVARPVTPDPRLDSRFLQGARHRLLGAMEDYTYVRKHYSIPAGATPYEPAASGFGESRDPGEIQAVIDGAAELLGEDRITGWRPDTELAPGTAVRYYYDETTLVLVWQELYEGRLCTWCEAKLSDPSQLRRKLSGDTYGWPIQAPASELAAQERAVAAVSADFYAFRSCGVYVYGGEVKSLAPYTADTLFVTEEGDMLLSRSGEIVTWDQARRYVADNHIAFSLAFGPILVENGRNVTPAEYPLGEINEEYSRAVIAQVGPLHYLFMAGNNGPAAERRFRAYDAAEVMLAHGCPMAYALDGGQTAEVIFRGAVCNTPDFGFERQVSDVLCFVTALPEEERR